MNCHQIIDCSRQTFCDNIVIIGNSSSGSGSAISIGVNHASFQHPDHNNVILIGNSAGSTGGMQEANTIALGAFAAHGGQNTNAIAIGYFAATNGPQGHDSIAIGRSAQNQGGGIRSISIGPQANTSPGEESIAIGYDSQADGSGSIAIGKSADANYNHSIVINATGGLIGATGPSSLFIAPIRTAANANILYYNTSTSEITYNPPTAVPCNVYSL